MCTWCDGALRVTDRPVDTHGNTHVAWRRSGADAERRLTWAHLQTCVMFPSFVVLLRDIVPASATQLLTLIAVSAWTASLCFTAARRAELRAMHGALAPQLATVLLLAAGLAVWSAAALTQPVQALQVAGASVALVFSWEAAGVLERAVRELI